MRASRFRAALPIAAIGVLILAACAKSTNPSSGGTTPSASAGAFGVTKDATIAAEVPAAIAAKGSITVASDASYAPMEFLGTDNKTVQGADADIATAVATVLGLKANIVNATFSGIIPGLQAGKYDVSWSSFFDTKEREKVVDMIDYFQAGSGIFTKSSNTTTYTSLSELCGQSVAAEDGTTELDDANAAAKKCGSKGAMKVLHFPSQNSVNLAVISGRALVGLADTEVAQYQIKITNGQGRFAGNYAPPILYGIAVPRPSGAAPGSGPLTKPILDALKKLYDDGTYKKILDKWGIASGALTAPGVNQATS
jgi:polar amino acid transport system substrate-binding protein